MYIFQHCLIESPILMIFSTFKYFTPSSRHMQDHHSQSGLKNQKTFKVHLHLWGLMIVAARCAILSDGSQAETHLRRRVQILQHGKNLSIIGYLTVKNTTQLLTGSNSNSKIDRITRAIHSVWNMPSPSWVL